MHIGIMRKKKLFAASMWYSPLEPETFSIIYGKIETIAMKIYSKMIKLPTYLSSMPLFYTLTNRFGITSLQCLSFSKQQKLGSTYFQFVEIPHATKPSSALQLKTICNINDNHFLQKAIHGSGFCLHFIPCASQQILCHFFHVTGTI